jgi:glycerophosphoryl diester phosphodiesterase
VEILCHRGLWTAANEQNTLAAFAGAWEHGFGIETDLRDRAGSVVIAHDPPCGAEPTLAELLAAHRDHGFGTTLALNVKADGLATAVADQLALSGTVGAFVFDMSVPDQRAWLGQSVPTYTRWSDVERVPVLLAEAAGVWLDAFADDGWWQPERIRAHLEAGRTVAIVSPELHRRDAAPVWARIAAAGLHRECRVALCTDRPFEARRYFS